MSFGDGNLHERMDELERHNKILQADVDLYRGRWMARGAAIAKQRERIEELGSLVLDMWETMERDTYAYDFDERLIVRKRMAALGLMAGDVE